MGMINGLIKQLQDMLLLYGNKTILTISDGENEYDIKSITGKPRAKYFEPKDKVAEVTITVKPTVEAIPKANYEARLKADLMAVFTELQIKFEENTVHWYVGRVDGKSDDVVLMETINDIIQQKINELKGE